MDKWYIADKHSPTKKRGPFCLQELQDQVVEGLLSRKMYIWKSGMKNWEKAGQVKQLAVSFQKQSNLEDDFHDDLDDEDMTEFVMDLHASMKLEYIPPKPVRVATSSQLSIQDLRERKTNMSVPKIQHKTKLHARHPSVRALATSQRTTTNVRLFETGLPFATFHNEKTYLGNTMAVNSQYCAVPWLQGDKVIIMGVNSEGIVLSKSLDVSSCYIKATSIKHTITDLCSQPFSLNTLITSSTDGNINTWILPDITNIPMNNNIEKPAGVLRDSERAYSTILRSHPYVNNLLGSVTDDGRILLWDLDHQTQLTSSQKHPQNINDIIWNNINGAELVSICKDELLRVFDPRTHQQESIAEVKTERACKILWPQENIIITMTFDNQLQQFELFDRRKMNTRVLVNNISECKYTDNDKPRLFHSKTHKTIMLSSDNTSKISFYHDTTTEHIITHEWMNKHEILHNNDCCIYRINPTHTLLQSHVLLANGNKKIPDDINLNLKSAREWYTCEEHVPIVPNESDSKELSYIIDELKNEKKEFSTLKIETTEELNSMRHINALRHRPVVVHRTGKLSTTESDHEGEEETNNNNNNGLEDIPESLIISKRDTEKEIRELTEKVWAMQEQLESALAMNEEYAVQLRHLYKSTISNKNKKRKKSINNNSSAASSSSVSDTTSNNIVVPDIERERFPLSSDFKLLHHTLYYEACWECM